MRVLENKDVEPEPDNAGIIQRKEPDSDTTVGQNPATSTGDCIDYHYVEKESIIQYQGYTESGFDVAANVIIQVLSLGLIQWRPNRDKIGRHSWKYGTRTTEWDENTCEPGIRHNETIRDELDDKIYYADSQLSPGDYIQWAWGQKIDDFGGGKLTITTGPLSLDGTPSKNGDDDESPNQHAPDERSDDDAPMDEYEPVDGPYTTPVYGFGYDDPESDKSKDNFISTKSGIISFGLNQVISGDQLINQMRHAQVNANWRGSLHIDSNKSYRIIDYSFKPVKASTTGIQSDGQWVTVKYGYWSLYLQEVRRMERR